MTICFQQRLNLNNLNFDAPNMTTQIYKINFEYNLLEATQKFTIAGLSTLTQWNFDQNQDLVSTASEFKTSKLRKLFTII